MGLKIFIFLFCLYHDVMSHFEVYSPDDMVDDITKQGHTVLKNELDKTIEESKRAHERFVAANASCLEAMLPIMKKCQNCVKDYCKDRFLKLGCEDTSEFNKAFKGAFDTIFDKIRRFFLITIPQFFTEDLKKFFGHKVPTFFKHDVKNFFEKDFTDFFKVTMPDFYENKFKPFFEKDVKNFFVKIGRFISDIFGRKKRSAAQEPRDCTQFESADKIQEVCSYYFLNCRDCLPTKEQLKTACPFLAEAHENLKQHNWLLIAAMSNSSVFVVFSLASEEEEPSNGVYNTIKANVGIFGQNATLIIDGPIKPSDPKNAAPIIVQAAVDWFKKHNNKYDEWSFRR